MVWPTSCMTDKFLKSSAVVDLQLLVSSFKVIRSSDNMEVTKRKTQSIFSKNTVLQSRQSTASLHSFFRKL